MTETRWRTFQATPEIKLDFWTCEGARTGPNVLLTAGVHGDEYEGPAALMQLAQKLSPAEVSGTITCVPVVNPLAFAAGTRLTPNDGLNLARTFPGRADGSITERLAAAFFENFAAKADYLIDLHSGGVEYLFVPLAGFYGDSSPQNRSYQSAKRFGIPVLWQLPETPGVLSREASTRGTVAIGLEYLGAGQLSQAGATDYCAGILSCLRFWGVVSGEPSSAACEIYSGDWQLAPGHGLFIPRAQLRDRVKARDIVAEIHAIPSGVWRIPADRDGVILGLRNKAYLRKDDWAVLIGRPLEEICG